MSIIQKLINLRAGLNNNTKISYYIEQYGYYFVIINMKNCKTGSPIFSIKFKDNISAQNFVKHNFDKSEFDIHIEDNNVIIKPRYIFSQLRIDCVNENIAKKLVKHFRKQYEEYENFYLSQKKKSSNLSNLKLY